MSSNNDIQTPVILQSFVVFAVLQSLDSFMQRSGCTFCQKLASLIYTLQAQQIAFPIFPPRMV